MIPFVYVYAEDQKTKACHVSIDGRPKTVIVAASRFIKAGGSYTVTVYSDNVAQLQAMVEDLAGNMHTVAVVHTQNDPLLIGPAADRLVLESVQALETVH